MTMGFKGWAIWGAAQIVVTYAIKLLIKLVDNAMMGWGDDRLAELFGITSPSASTVFNWTIPFALAAVALWNFHHFTTRPLREALANRSGGGDSFSATGTVSWPPRRTWIQRMEPSHIIIVGLVIAACGVVWQSLYSSPQENDPRIADLQSQVESLRHQLISRQSPAMNQVATAPATTPPRITTAPADIPKKLAAIDTLRQILDGDMAPWINKGQQLTTGAWLNWAIGGETSQLKDEVRKFYQRGREIHEKLEQLKKDNVQFPDIYALTSSPLGTAYLLRVDKFVTPVLALPDGPLTMSNELYRFLFEPYAKEAYETLNEVDGWRRTTDQNALQLRQKISQ